MATINHFEDLKSCGKLRSQRHNASDQEYIDLKNFEEMNFKAEETSKTSKITPQREKVQIRKRSITRNSEC